MYRTRGRIQDFSKGGGVHLRSTSKNKGGGGGPGEGPILGPMVKSLHSVPKKGGPDPLPPVLTVVSNRTVLVCTGYQHGKHAGYLTAGKLMAIY